MHNDHEQDRFQPVALALGWLVPGAGHVYLGHVGRGIAIGFACIALFVSGLLIGSFAAVDSGGLIFNLARSAAGKPAHRVADGEPVWFLGTSFVGPLALGVDYYHQYHLKVSVQSDADPSTTELRAARPNEGRAADGSVILGGTPPYTRAVARPAEIGTLYCCVAGLLNLIALIDVAHSRRRTRPEQETAR